jgi:hypothetical protein
VLALVIPFETCGSRKMKFGDFVIVCGSSFCFVLCWLTVRSFFLHAGDDGGDDGNYGGDDGGAGPPIMDRSYYFRWRRQ